MKKNYLLAAGLCCGLIVGLASHGVAASKAIEVEVVSPSTPPVNVPINGAMYGNIVTNNGNTTINGADACTTNPQPPVPAIAYNTSATLGSHPSQVTTAPPATQTKLISPPMDVNALAASFQSVATITSPQNPIGSPTDYKIAYISGDWNESNLVGYGVLVVVGDFKATAKLDWNGLIIVTGETEIAGGGSTGANIRGALISGGDIKSNGNMNTGYDSCQIQLALNPSSTNPMEYSVDRWRTK